MAHPALKAEYIVQAFTLNGTTHMKSNFCLFSNTGLQFSYVSSSIGLYQKSIHSLHTYDNTFKSFFNNN
jgi:hypothetical protein